MIYRLKVTEVQSLHIRFWKKQGKYFNSLMVLAFQNLAPFTFYSKCETCTLGSVCLSVQYMYGDTEQIFGITHESKERAPVRLIKSEVFLYMERMAQFGNQH